MTTELLIEVLVFTAWSVGIIMVSYRVGWENGFGVAWKYPGHSWIVTKKPGGGGYMP